MKLQGMKNEINKREYYFYPMNLMIFPALFMLLSLSNRAVLGDDSLKTDSSLTDYFMQYGISLDSCSNIALYEEVCYWLETPYSYGGISENGIDCSGLAKTLYARIYHTTLGGSSSDMYLATGMLYFNSFCEGDLLFFKINGKRVSHVGVYLSNNKFVHASVQKGVTIDDLDFPYYKRRFAGGGNPSSDVEKQGK